MTREKKKLIHYRQCSPLSSLVTATRLWAAADRQKTSDSDGPSPAAVIDPGGLCINFFACCCCAHYLLASPHELQFLRSLLPNVVTPLLFALSYTSTLHILVFSVGCHGVQSGRLCNGTVFDVVSTCWSWGVCLVHGKTGGPTPLIRHFSLWHRLCICVHAAAALTLRTAFAQ